MKPLIFGATLMSLFACSSGDGRYVASVVRVPVEGDRDSVLDAFKAAAPHFASVPGLLRKYFVLTDDGAAGGIYLWESRSAAEAYFDDDWHARTSSRYGRAPEVSFYEAPVLSPSATEASPTEASVATIVDVTPPWYAFRPLVVRKYREAVPTYQAVPGLLYKYFSISSEGKIGGIYLWENRQAANEFYDEAWHARIVDTYGKPGHVEYFDAPLVLANRER
ncbi:MAG: YdhR family protein [Myxococcota bacterium]